MDGEEGREGTYDVVDDGEFDGDLSCAVGRTRSCCSWEMGMVGFRLPDQLRETIHQVTPPFFSLHLTF